MKTPARLYRLGKSDFAIAKVDDYFLVYKSVRQKWQRVSMFTTFVEAKLSIFNSYAVDKGNIEI